MDKKAEILNALRSVQDPDGGADIVALDMVSDIQLMDDGSAIVMIEVDPARGAQMEPLRQQAEQAVQSFKFINKANVILTAERQAASAPPPARKAPDPHGMTKNPKLTIPARHIVAVASGKGGVGKSTVAANLAVSLSKQGLNVGLLDADIYGPSLPKMFGVEGQKPKSDADKIIPLDVDGIKLMSIGFLVDAAKALVWRGPMAQSALYQMMRDVHWAAADAPLDILLVDMPPGTGDIQLTLAQKVDVAGAVIVSTPQDIALIDARKGIEMFGQVDVPILGLIENMSTHVCSACGHEEHIFGHGGAQQEAKRMDVPFLGDIPLHASIRFSGDDGAPVTQADPSSPVGQSFMEMAKQITKRLEGSKSPMQTIAQFLSR